MEEEPLIGQQVSRYRILDHLGAGGMAKVYLAEDSQLGRRVALKVLPDDFAQDPDRIARFEREAKALAALNHPNIVTVYSIEEVDNLHFIAMELVEGETLESLVLSDNITLDRFLEISIALADALSAAHDRGILHRDLKPGNIMLTERGHVKVLDFGLAKLFEPGDASEVQHDQPTELLTQEGAIIGTVTYMSPEQAQGRPLDRRTDIFSLGVILYEMATGQRPFSGDSSMEVVSSILRDRPQVVTAMRPNLPRQLGRIIEHCLRKDPKNRFQTARDILNELKSLEKELQAEEILTSAVSAPSAPPVPKKNWLPVLGIAGLAVAAVAIGYVVVTGRTSPQTGQAQGPVAGVADSRQRIVVLPFENQGDPGDAYFAEGITEEINSRLSAVSGLAVISRTSARQYDRTNKSTEQIGADLNVGWLLEGTVRWSRPDTGAQSVRVTPRLIRVTDDTQPWSDNYDGVIDNIFTVQSEIASSVVRELGVTLQQPERGAIEARPTQNMDAYQAFLRGQSYAAQPLAEETQAMAIQMLTRAVDLDPEFTSAWAALTKAHALTYFNSWDQESGHLAAARNALERASQLNPESAEVRIAAGYYNYYGLGEYDLAAAEFQSAADQLPNNTSVLVALAYLHRRQGRVEQARGDLEDALELDPHNVNLLDQIAETCQALRQYSAADEYWQQAIAKAPDEPSLYLDRAENSVRWHGQTREARSILKEAPGNPQLLQWDRLDFFDLDFFDRRFDSLGSRLTVRPSDGPVKTAKALLFAGLVEKLAGETAARDSLESARREIERLSRQFPDTPILRSALALASALTERPNQASLEGQAAIELTQTDRYSGPLRKENLAAAFAWSGEADRAIDLLEELLETEYQRALSAQLLALDPTWDQLRDHPRFIRLLPPE